MQSSQQQDLRSKPGRKGQERCPSSSKKALQSAYGRTVEVRIATGDALLRSRANVVVFFPTSWTDPARTTVAQAFGRGVASATQYSLLHLRVLCTSVTSGRFTGVDQLGWFRTSITIRCDLHLCAGSSSYILPQALGPVGTVVSRLQICDQALPDADSSASPARLWQAYP